ncbi:hypothetical protein GCM10007981_03070 [Thermocladium modestius]|uniref:V-type ATP synthase subunit F n=1 Tax=Thermocladium modestius TaxID=62609 RepID=A0A830GU04_9CREN|nr:V-type ATP synthase subunit F [Thermocladium modestius]GGP19428.1 hypothetical protein GCM10007981_03070 [Thermocladium modestius]
MRVVTIGDDRTVTALKLLGIEGYAVKSPGDAVKLINSFLEDPDVAGIFISSSIMDGIRDYVDKVKERRRTPMLMEFPSLEGAEYKPIDYLKTLRSALGM